MAWFAPEGELGLRVLSLGLELQGWIDSLSSDSELVVPKSEAACSWTYPSSTSQSVHLTWTETGRLVGEQLDDCPEACEAIDGSCSSKLV